MPIKLFGKDEMWAFDKAFGIIHEVLSRVREATTFAMAGMVREKQLATGATEG